MSYHNRPSFRYKKPEAQNGDLRTPLTFYTSQVEEGVDGRDVSYKKAFYTMGQVYSPSMKDIEIASGKSMRAKMTLKIRDPLADYQPENQHFVEVEDIRLTNKKWQIIDIRPDYDNRDFLIVIIGGGQDV
uniref:Head closure knob n=1 Tax=Siphoviridae sp. ct7xv9 TaxID=2825355 RepID=A0A8S5PMU7_9CAUD|nr:MAG TPA: head closure knob [Siphoviridae sp. ct7xv9]